MKVKDLIKFLKKQNPEDIIGMRDYGVDSGDFTPFEEREHTVFDDELLYPNLFVYSKEKAEKIIKEQ